MREQAELPPADLAAFGPGHPPPEMRVEIHRQQRSLVRPIFEEPAAALRAPGIALEQGAVIVAQSRKGRQIVHPRQYVDAVDLVEAQPIHGAAEMRGADAGGPAQAEALRREEDAAHLLRRKRFPGAHCAASAARSAGSSCLNRASTRLPSAGGKVIAWRTAAAISVIISWA